MSCLCDRSRTILRMPFTRDDLKLCFVFFTFKGCFIFTFKCSCSEFCFSFLTLQLIPDFFALKSNIKLHSRLHCHILRKRYIPFFSKAYVFFIHRKHETVFMDIYIYKGVKYGFSVITVVNHVCIDLLPNTVSDFK